MSFDVEAAPSEGANDKSRRHRASEGRQADAVKQTTLLLEMVEQNTALTETIKSLTERLEALTVEVHKSVAKRN